VRASSIAACALLAALAAPISRAAPVAAPPDTRVCGQIQGPHVEYLSAVSGLKSRGSTWTVIATGVPCGEALAKSPRLLGLWVKAKVGARLPLAGYTCSKMADSAYSGSGRSSGGFVCHRGPGPAASVFGPNTFTARGTAPYTVAQIKAFFGIR